MVTTPSRLLAVIAFVCGTSFTTPGGVAAPAPKKFRSVITPANAGKVRQLEEIDDKNSHDIVWRPDGNQVAFVAWKGPVEVLAASDFRPLRTVGAGKRLAHFAFHPDCQTVAFCGEGTEGNWVELLNLRTKRSVRIKTKEEQPRMAFSPDGKLLATGGFGTAARVWDPAGGRLVRSLEVKGKEGFLRVAFSPDGKVLAVGNRSDATCLFEVATGKLLHVLDKPLSLELKFSPDGKTLAVVYVDGIVALWDVATGKLLRRAKTGAAEIVALDWTPDGGVLATAGHGGAFITLWDPKTLTALKRLEAPHPWVICVRFTPDGARLLTAGSGVLASQKRKVTVWGLR